MDGERFDAITRAWATPSRRRVLQGLVGGGMSALAATLGREPARAQPNANAPTCQQTCQGLPPGRDRAACLRAARGQDVTCPENCAATLTNEGECRCLSTGSAAIRFDRCTTDADCLAAGADRCDPVRRECSEGTNIPCAIDADCAFLGTCREGWCGGPCTHAECEQHFGTGYTCNFFGFACSAPCGV